jgi:hypothetical protein
VTKALPVKFFILALSWISPALAMAPEVPCQILFFLHTDDSNLRAPIASVSLSDKYFAIVVIARPKPIGRYELRVKLYDSNSREVRNSSATDYSTQTGIGSTVGYRFDDTDPPGTWWVAVHLNDQLIASQSVVVRPREK